MNQVESFCCVEKAAVTKDLEVQYNTDSRPVKGSVSATVQPGALIRALEQRYRTAHARLSSRVE